MDQVTGKFEGYALVEIMGHQRVAGYVLTESYGSQVLFHVRLPAGEPEEVTLTDQRYIPGHGYLPAGSRLRVTRQEVDQLVGPQSLYRLTRISEAEARAAAPQSIELLERGSAPALESPAEIEEETAEYFEVPDEPQCEGCGCSNHDACLGGCAWDEGFQAAGRAVCSRCVEMVRLRDQAGKDAS